jgi:hypothetical protein
MHRFTHTHTHTHTYLWSKIHTHVHLHKGARTHTHTHTHTTNIHIYMHPRLTEYRQRSGVRAPTMARAVREIIFFITLRKTSVPSLMTCQEQLRYVIVLSGKNKKNEKHAYNTRISYSYTLEHAYDSQLRTRRRKTKQA